MKTSAISRQRKDIHPVKKYAIFLNPEYNIYCGVGAKDLGNFYHPSQAPSFSWKVPAQTLAPAPCGFIAAEHSHTNPSRCSWASVGIYCLVYPNPRASLLSCVGSILSPLGTDRNLLKATTHLRGSGTWLNQAWVSELWDEEQSCLPRAGKLPWVCHRQQGLVLSLASGVSVLVCSLPPAHQMNSQILELSGMSLQQTSWQEAETLVSVPQSLILI